MRPWLLLVVLPACAAAPAAAPSAETAKWPRNACDSTEIEDERLVVDWSPLDRSRLEAAARRGVIPVRVEGCRTRIVLGCTLKRSYTFAATSRQREVMQFQDHDDMQARLPLLAARLGAGVMHTSALDLTMTVVGRYESGGAPVTEADLEGECRGVTHVAASVSVGAFSIASSDTTAVDAAADLASVTHARGRKHLDAAGVESSCSNARRADSSPPDDCAVPLRVELRALSAAKATRPTASAPAPSPSPSAPANEDTMPRSMEAVKKELAYCHRVARASSPDLSGVLTLSVKLARNGYVRSVGVKTEGNLDDKLADCAVERVGHVLFPAADDDRPRLVAIPVLFRPLAR